MCVSEGPVTEEKTKYIFGSLVQDLTTNTLKQQTYTKDQIILFKQVVQIKSLELSLYLA